MPRKGDIDPIWETLVDIIGEAPITKSERGRWNKVVKEFREAEITPDEIRKRARRYAQVFPGAVLTPTALTANWTSLKPLTSPSLPIYIPDEELPACEHGVAGGCRTCRLANIARLKEMLGEAKLGQGEGL